MKFSLLILGSPISSQSSESALRFAKAALQDGHNILRVFFFDDGVTIANELVNMPQDELNYGEHWQQLGAQHQIDLVICVSSALKRGILDKTEASRYDKSSSNLLPNFEISGLGQLVDASLNSDRLITFGA